MGVFEGKALYFCRDPVGGCLLWKCYSVGGCPSQKCSSVDILRQMGSRVLFGFKYKVEWEKKENTPILWKGALQKKMSCVGGGVDR